jgi:RNA polymerase sigma-70 factor (ECF subfamily)
MVRLNRAVAVSEAFDVRTGLCVLESLDGELDGHHLRWAVEADFHRRLADPAAAARCYQQALGCHPNPTERRFLERRLVELGAR